MFEEKDLEPFEVDSRMVAHSNYWTGEMGSRFYVSLRDKKKLFGVYCPRCNKTLWPPRTTCFMCFSKINKVVELGPCGTLETFTLVTYSEPVHPRPAPFMYGVVKLDGADTGMAHIIDEVDIKDVHIGMRVKPVFATERKGNILDIKYFKPL